MSLLEKCRESELQRLCRESKSIITMKNNIFNVGNGKLQSGYWNIDSGRGCDPCDCDVIGSTDRSCDQVTSQCHCHAGIGGRNCSECLPKHYGFSASGCKRKLQILSLAL